VSVAWRRCSVVVCAAVCRGGMVSRSFVRIVFLTPACACMCACVFRHVVHLAPFEWNASRKMALRSVRREKLKAKQEEIVTSPAISEKLFNE